MQNSEEITWLAESIFKMTWGYNSIVWTDSSKKENKDASKEKKDN